MSTATELHDHPTPNHTFCNLAACLTPATFIERVNNIDPTVPVAHEIITSDPDCLPQSDNGSKVTVCSHPHLFWHFQVCHGAVEVEGDEHHVVQGHGCVAIATEGGVPELHAALWAPTMPPTLVAGYETTCG